MTYKMQKDFFVNSEIEGEPQNLFLAENDLLSGEVVVKETDPAVCGIYIEYFDGRIIFIDASHFEAVKCCC